MKRYIKVLLTLCVVCAFVSVLFGCKPEGENPPGPSPNLTVNVEAVQNAVTVKDREVGGFDYTTLFSITEGEQSVAVIADYIDASEVKAVPGTYVVKCTYKEETATVNITVEATAYNVTLSQSKVSVKVSECADYNFNALFTVTVDGNPAAVTDDMVTSDVKAEVGTYTYTVKAGDVSKTLEVEITPDHLAEAFAAYRSYEMTLAQLTDFDFSQLFYLYVDGAEIQVTAEMIDASALDDAAEESSYTVLLTYNSDLVSASADALVKIVPEESVSVSTKQIVTYPNAEIIDLTTLFEVKKGDKNIAVTADMISGTINYSQVGVNEIKLNYDGQEYISTVEVKRGVIIEYAKSDVVVIKKGVDQNSYNFGGDFKIYINGIYLPLVSQSDLDISSVDFTTAGEYEAKITVAYNNKKPTGVSGTVKFEYFEKTIKYIVVEKEYSIKVVSDTVTLPKNTTEYKVYKNLSVTINGIAQTLTENKDWVDSMSCYAQTLSAPLDFTKSAVQEVKIAVYVNGPDAEPVEVSFYVVVDTGLKVEAANTVIFEGATFYTKNLFKISDSSGDIEVKNDYISGKVDTFNAGSYSVSIEYQGVVKTAVVTVLGREMIGTYVTKQTTIPAAKSTAEDASEDEESPVYPVGDLVISENGTFEIDGVEAQLLYAIDDSTLVFTRRSTEYTLYFNKAEGIIVLVPTDSTTMIYNNERRALIYFSEDLYKVSNKTSINGNSVHVLESNIVGYSIDVFRLRSKADDSIRWYGLKVYLVERNSSDTFYEVSWGEVVFADNFSNTEVGLSSSMTFLGETYKFEITSSGVGKVPVPVDQKPYANTVFTGTVEGAEAELRADSNQNFDLYVDSVKVLSAGGWEIKNMYNGGVDADNKIVFLYSIDQDGTIYSYKFTVNPDDFTFELLARDRYFGKYFVTDSMYLFIDGYGTGQFGVTKSAATTFTYTVNGNELEIVFTDAKPSFQYGKSITFFVSDLLNVLTVKETSYTALSGKQFVNKFVSDGAIVNVGNFVVGKGTTKDDLVQSIEITTKDGVLDNTAKKTCVKTENIRFTTVGYYEFSIEITVTGQTVVSYYGLQIVDEILKDSPLVATYGKGLLFESNSLSIDRFGRVQMVREGVSFMGLAKMTAEKEFIAQLYSQDKQFTLRGVMIEQGLLKISASEGVSFVDYFTTGSVRMAGTDNCYLREFNIAGKLVYVFSTIKEGIGEVVSVESTNGVEPSYEGAELKITLSDGTVKYVKVVSWTSTTEGLKIISK